MVPAQPDTRSELIQRQEVSFEVSGALPDDFVLLAYSLDGLIVRDPA